MVHSPEVELTVPRQLKITRIQWESVSYNGFTLWLFNIAMENGPFIDDFPIEWLGFSMVMLNNQMVSYLITLIGP